MRYKVSGAIAIPKASWGCAPALPNRIQMVSLRITIPNQKPQANKKFFDPAIFQKCCRGVGEQPTFAKQTKLCNLASLLQLHFFKTSQFGINCSQRNQSHPVRQKRFAVCLCAVRRCCVVRIAYESFLDCSLQEFFLFFRMANSSFTYFSQIPISSNQYLC